MFILLLIVIVTVVIHKLLRVLGRRGLVTPALELGQQGMGRIGLFINDLITNRLHGRQEFTRLLRNHHQSPDYATMANLSMWHIQMMNIPMDNKIEMNVMYYESEIEIHDGRKDDAENCMRRSLDWNTMGSIVDDVFPGITQKCQPRRFQVWLHRFQRQKMVVRILNSGATMWRMTGIYADFLRDCLLFYSLHLLLPGWFKPENSNLFASQIMILLFSSIVVPVLAIGVKVGLQAPLLVLGYEAHNNFRQWRWWTGAIVRAVNVVLAPFLPALLTHVKEFEKLEINTVLEQKVLSREKLERAKDKVMFLKTVKKSVLYFKETELFMEISIQLTVQLTMQFLNMTNTQTVRGLEAVFSKEKSYTGGLGGFEDFDVINPSTWNIWARLGVDTTFLLWLSITWTLKTILTTHMGLKSIDKDGFLPIKGKIVLGLRALLTMGTRVFTFIFYFSSFLGLWNLLGHHKAEEASFRPNDQLSGLYNPFNISTGVNISLQFYNTSIPWTDIYRSNYSTDPPTPPSYSLYTGMELDWAYFFFWVILIIQFGIIFVVKLKKNKSFRNAKFYKKVWHSMTGLILPDAFNDWDKDLEADVRTLRQRFQEVGREITGGVILHWVFNMVLLFPIMVTGIELTIK